MNFNGPEHRRHEAEDAPVRRPAFVSLDHASGRAECARGTAGRFERASHRGRGSGVVGVAHVLALLSCDPGFGLFHLAQATCACSDSRHPLIRPRFGLFPPLVVVSLVGELTRINEVEQLAFVGLLQVLILAILGLQVYRTILFPSLFLFFLVPMGEYLILPLQHFTTHFISAGLTLLGIPHYTEVNLIQLSNGNYEVAEACAGLRFLIATIAVGALFVHLTYRKWYKIVLYLAASVVVPVIANGFRALGIVLLGYWSDNRIAHGVDHIIYGWGFLVAILLVLMFIGMRYADPIPQEESGDAVAAPALRPHAFALTVLFSLAAICFVPALLYWQSHRPLHVDIAAFSAPLTPAGWQTRCRLGRLVAGLCRARRALGLCYARGGPIHARCRCVRELLCRRKWKPSTSSVPPTNCGSEDVWHPLSQGRAEAVIGGHMVHLGEAVISSAGLTRIIWWTYWSGGRFTTSGLDVKLDRLRPRAVGWRRLGACRGVHAGQCR